MRCWLKYGQCKLRSNPPSEPLSDALAAEVILSYKRATESNESDYRAWHSWALINFRLAEQIHGSDKEQSSNRNPESVLLHNHVIAAVKGKAWTGKTFLREITLCTQFVSLAFVLAISMGTKRWSASVQQDMLNLLSCLFKYGELHDVARTINDGLGKISLNLCLKLSMAVLTSPFIPLHLQGPSRSRLGLVFFHSCWREYKLSPSLSDRSYTLC